MLFHKTERMAKLPIHPSECSLPVCALSNLGYRLSKLDCKGGKKGLDVADCHGANFYK